jgi:glycosyltransferase involved in cell wall biosynthesis
MKISVALCTYNGEQYLKDQLDSYLLQTVLPDEVVICDDCSTDDTLAILDKFKQLAPFNVRVTSNQKQIGSTKNFEQAISKCNGDLIFLSDQDDWWDPQKIETLLTSFSGGVGNAGVFSDAEIVDEHLQPLNNNLWNTIGFSSRQQNNFSGTNAVKTLIKQNVVTGATLAFDAQYKEYLLPIPDIWLHDAWIALLLACRTNLHCIRAPLVKYRQHGHQQIGIRGHSLRQKVSEARYNDKNVYLLQAELFRLVRSRIRTHSKVQYNPDISLLIDEKINHMEQRARIDNHTISRLTIPFSELMKGRYHQYSFGWRSFFKDLIFGH